MTQASDINPKGHTLLWSHHIELQSNSPLSSTKILYCLAVLSVRKTLPFIPPLFDLKCIKGPLMLAVTVKGQQLYYPKHFFLLLCATMFYKCATIILIISKLYFKFVFYFTLFYLLYNLPNSRGHFFW